MLSLCVCDMRSCTQFSFTLSSYLPPPLDITLHFVSFIRLLISKIKERKTKQKEKIVFSDNNFDYAYPWKKKFKITHTKREEKKRSYLKWKIEVRAEKRIFPQAAVKIN